MLLLNDLISLSLFPSFNPCSPTPSHSHSLSHTLLHSFTCTFTALTYASISHFLMAPYSLFVISTVTVLLLSILPPPALYMCVVQHGENIWYNRFTNNFPLWLYVYAVWLMGVCRKKVSLFPFFSLFLYACVSGVFIYMYVMYHGLYYVYIYCEMHASTHTIYIHALPTTEFE